ncbi:hypothetical protein V2W45_1474723 [Cenococcum geophilum]
MLALTTLATIALILFALVNAYIKLNKPMPYSKDTLNNNPLNNTGDDFPYKQRTSVYDILEINNIKKVVYSIIGGYPLNIIGNLIANIDGNSAAVFQYTLPKGILNSYNREIYINCALITVTSSGNNNLVIEKLPNIFIANISFKTCNIPENFNYQFPNPGNSIKT